MTAFSKKVMAGRIRRCLEGKERAQILKFEKQILTNFPRVERDFLWRRIVDFVVASHGGAVVFLGVRLACLFV